MFIPLVFSKSFLILSSALHAKQCESSNNTFSSHLLHRSLLVTTLYIIYYVIFVIANSSIVAASNNISNEYNIHMITSTECSSYQDWQTEGLLYTHWMVKQPGKFTRVKSKKQKSNEKLNNVALPF